VRGTLLQFQLSRLIGDILAEKDLAPNLRASLLRHSDGYPENPGQALLAHLHDIHAPDDLPPYRARRTPAAQQPAK
jgi:hypothetical protein